MCGQFTSDDTINQMVPIKFELDYHLSETDRKILQVPVMVYFIFKEINKLYNRLQKKRKKPRILQGDFKRKILHPVFRIIAPLLVLYLLTIDHLPALNLIFTILLLIAVSVFSIYISFLVTFFIFYEITSSSINLIKATYIVISRIILNILRYFRIL